MDIHFLFINHIWFKQFYISDKHSISFSIFSYACPCRSLGGQESGSGGPTTITDVSLTYTRDNNAGRVPHPPQGAWTGNLTHTSTAIRAAIVRERWVNAKPLGTGVPPGLRGLRSGAKSRRDRAAAEGGVVGRPMNGRYQGSELARSRV